MRHGRRPGDGVAAGVHDRRARGRGHERRGDRALPGARLCDRPRPGRVVARAAAGAAAGLTAGRCAHRPGLDRRPPPRRAVAACRCHRRAAARG